MNPYVIAVLDDDPTGSQTVHGVPIVLALDDDALVLDADTTFFLTNSRSLPEAEAAELTERVARRLFEQDPDVEIISRSDSTLRGHVAAEVAAIERARVAVVGRATTRSCSRPRSSRRAATPATTSTTRVTPRSRRPSSPATPRSATAPRTCASSCARRSAKRERRDRWVIVNAESYEDLDAVVREARASGKRFLYRTGPSFVRALAGIKPIPPLTEFGRRDGHGLVVVGSHVGLTTRQVEAVEGWRRSSSTSPRSTPKASARA